MFNCLFAEKTELSKYLHSLEFTLPEMPERASIDVSFDSSAVTLTIRATYVNVTSTETGTETITETTTKTVSTNSTFGNLYVIRNSDIVVVGRMPYTAKSYKNIPVLPSVVTVARSVAETVEISVKVQSPLTAVVTGSELLFDINRSAVTSYAEDATAGTRTINGIYPDDNGNITILSKSPEVTVNVLSSNNSVS